MNVPFRWTFVIVALLATVGAIVVTADFPLAVGFAAVAVLAAGLALWDSLRTPEIEVAPTPAAAAPPEGGSEVWFASGEMGQEAIILLLDRVDRALVHPALPSRETAELEEISALSREEFLEYVEYRLAELEAAA